MTDLSRTNQELIEEISILQRRIRELEQSEGDRKKTEETLRDTETRYRLLFEHSPDGIVITDPATARILEFNETAHRQLGYSREEFARLSISDLDIVETHEEIRSQIAKVVQGGRHDFETLHRTRQGEIRNVHVTAQFTEILGQPVYHCIWRDITDRKRVEEMIQKRIVALTQPMEGGTIAFEELFNIYEIQRIQDEFATATGVASIITYPDGTPLTAPSNFTYLCSDIIRKTEKGLSNCFRSDAALGRYNPDGPIVQPCLSGGLWDAGASITVGGHHIANWLIGQVRDEAQTEERMRAYAREIGADEPSFMKAFHEVPAMSREKFEQIAKALFTLANQLSTTAYQNVQQARFITERKQVDEELKQSEEKFSTIFRLSPACISLSTLADGRYVAANDLWFKTAEYSPEEVIGHTTTELGIWVNPEDRKRLAQTIMEGGVVRDHEYLFRSKSGKIYTLLFSAEVIEINGVPHIVSIALDITERIRAEAARRESEQRLSAFIDFLPDATLAIDENKRIIIWNRAIEEMTGIPAEEMIGKGDYAYTIPFYGVARPQLMDLFWESEHEIAAKYPIMERAGENLVIEVFCPALYDGKGAFVWAKAAPLRDTKGRIIGAIECIRDITEREQAEDEIRRVTTFLDSIIENIPDMIFVKDAKELRFVRFNRAGEELLGHSREDLLGKNDHDFFPKEQADFFTEKDRDVLRRSEIVDIPEEPIQTRNKGERTLHTKKVPILDAKGEAEYLLGISEDITDRKRTAEEKQSLEERLQRAEKMEALGTLAGGVAHDLNNVLGIIVGYAEMLLDDVDKPSSTRSRLVKIMEGGQRAAAIVQDLLTLARRGVSNRQILNLNKIIADCQQSPEVENLSSYHPSLRIKADFDPDLLNISGSSVHLGKTLLNLVSNAGETMPNGGIVTIKTANQYLDKPIQGYDEVREGESDTGEGIPADDLKRIFEPFYTKKVMGRSGTGLGLAVVWGTVKDHYGYINVESEEGIGSTFTLYFPVTREEISSEAVAVSISEYMGKGEFILIVDDVKGQRDLAAEMLRKLNYNVTGVSSGEKAVAYLKEHQIDLIVLDMIMDPGMDGLDTYRSVLEIHPKQKAIIVSGFSETYRVNAAQSLGAGAYVRKPYVIEKLGMAVRKELDRE
ncbi:MAG: PAS domain S-box protein [Deltaproteobacteria bacterium]|nr:PAS domain S-box protein [Deltaproteobacteria bacterium]